LSRLSIAFQLAKKMAEKLAGCYLLQRALSPQQKQSNNLTQHI
jgi:hypothetical protein